MHRSLTTGDKVIVVKGFFKDSLGTITEIYPPTEHSLAPSYGIDLNNQAGVTWFGFYEVRGLP